METHVRKVFPCFCFCWGIVVLLSQEEVPGFPLKKRVLCSSSSTKPYSACWGERFAQLHDSQNSSGVLTSP